MNRQHSAKGIHTIVIGGGQAGLSVGYHLAKRNLPFLILDANHRIGDAWRKRWDSLRLFTPARYAGMPGFPFPAQGDSFPTKEQMADYLESYAERNFDTPVLGLGDKPSRVDCGSANTFPPLLVPLGQGRFIKWFECISAGSGA